MTGLEQWTATGRGQLRAAHADRDQVVAALQAAFVQGRLDKGELDARVGQALASRTYAELAALTADLPAGPTYVPAVSAAAGTAAAEPGRTPGRTFAKAAYRSAIFLLLTIALVEGGLPHRLRRLPGPGHLHVHGVYRLPRVRRDRRPECAAQPGGSRTRARRNR